MLYTRIAQYSYSTALVPGTVGTIRCLDSRLLEYRTVLWRMVLTLTWMPWIEFLSRRTCTLLWILYGNMVDFSFIVSLYVSDLLNVTISIE